MEDLGLAYSSRHSLFCSSTQSISWKTQTTTFFCCNTEFCDTGKGCQGILISASRQCSTKCKLWLRLSRLSWRLPLSIIGSCVCLVISQFHGKFKKQSAASFSFVEAENRAMATSCGISWLFCLLVDPGISCLLPASLCCNDTVALHVPTNPIL